MSEDTRLKELIINTLSPEQFEPITPSETEIYLVEDDAEYATVEELATKQDVINDLEQIRTNANLVTTKQDIISDLSTIRSNASTGAGLAPQVAVNTQRIEDLTTAKFPNVVIIGTPHIEGGQVSNYSDTSYLQFPFVDISRGQPFDIYFSFTTSSDITTQQNILDSYFGIALAIQNGKGVMALSSNGQSWDIGMTTGTNTLKANTTYYVKYSWTGTQYNASLSLNDETYMPDMTLNSNLSPYKTTIFIGGSPNLFGPSTAHPFKGTINFNKSKVVVNNITVWEGMADVGIASRANVSLNNLDEVGEARFTAKQNASDNALTTTDKTIVGAINELKSNKQDVIDDLEQIRTNANQISDKVSKSGDTMTGTLTNAYLGDSTSDSSTPIIVTQKNAGDFGNTTFSNFIVKDSKGNNVAIFGGKQWTNGHGGFRLLTWNVDTKSWNNHPYLKWTYVNGTSGFRIWSDGYCEQWGITQMNGSTVTNTLLKTYANTDYLVILTCGSNTTSWPIVWTNNIWKTTSSFWFDGTGNQSGTDRTILVNWEVRGYLATGQY